jgi:hypothetical protein
VVLHFPVVGPLSYGELEIFLGDGIPELQTSQYEKQCVTGVLWVYLVDHHDRKQVQEGCEEESIHVVLYVGADRLGECVEQDLADDECRNAKANVPQRPALLQRTDDQHDLHDNVDEEEDRGEDVDHHKEADGALRAKTSPALERKQSDHEADHEHGQTADAQQPDREGSSIFVELETDEAVDHQAYASGASEAALHSNEVWVRLRSRWHNTAVDDERADGEQGV